MATLVLGGARSGKSAHGEGLLADGAATYVATARRDPADAEWEARIAAHAARRPASWRTVELAAPGELATIIGQAGPDDPPILVDDIATWVTGLFDDAGSWDGGSLAGIHREYERLADAVERCRTRLVLVSAEVGLGVVPATKAGRLFRDELGALNAILAQRCGEVLLLVAGLPLRLR